MRAGDGSPGPEGTRPPLFILDAGLCAAGDVCADGGKPRVAAPGKAGENGIRRRGGRGPGRRQIV